MKKSDLQDIYPLSPLQEGLLFQHLYAPDSGAYFEQISFRVVGDLDLGAFAASWNQLLERHDILRSAFAYEKAERPVQIVPRQRAIELAVTDLRHLTDATREHEIAAFRERDRARSFDLRRDVLMRVQVFRAGERDHRVVWSHHHILLDGWSVGILYQELMQIYAARSRGLAPELPTPVPYVRYIEWLRKQDVDGSAAYWRARLAGFTQPTGIPPLAAAGSAAGRAVACDFTLATAQTEALKHLASGARATLSTLVQCLWALLLARYNCSDDLVFGVTVSIRPEDLPGSGDMVGLLINTVPVRLRAAADQPFLDFLQQTQEEALARRPHEHYPLYRIQGEAQLRTLFDHLLVFENYPLGRPPQTPAGLAIEDIRLSEQAHYPLCVVVVPGTDGLRLRLAYDPARYLPEQLQRLEGHLRRLIGTVLDDPRLPLRAIGILSPAERLFLTAGLNATARPYPREQTVVELFEAQAAARPADPAVVCGQVRLSYADLEARANRLAHRLRDDHGIGPDACVGLLLGRSELAIVAMLAVLKAGGAYVPIDPGYPRRRIDFMLADAHCRVVVTQPEHGRLAGARPLLMAADAAAAFDPAKARNPRPLAGPTNLAYVMYTSGTTGEPKGVMVPHRAIVRLVKDTNYIVLTPETRILQTGPLTFDAATFEIWGALLNGGTIVTTAAHEILDIEALGRALRDHAITTMWLTASLCNQLVEQDLSLFAGLRELLVGGERLSPVHIERLRAAHSGLVVINGYGPTENTTFTTCCRLDGRYDGDLPIGRPVANTRVYLLDERLEPVPIGVPGRLYTSGDGLALGYLNQPELTAQRFVDCPFEPGERMYDTGDLARRLPDGNLAFSGRRDDQVKIRGHRIECGEIAQHLLQHPAIRQAAVIPRECADGTRELIAYVVVGTGLTTTALRDFLAERLPEYMIPARFAALAALPLTPNGKIDQCALPAADLAGLDQGTVFAAPREGLEATLAAIWAEVLGRGNIGAEDNFFDLGGDSIKAIQIMARLHRLDLRLAIRDFFAHPSIRALAPRLVSATRAIPQGQVGGTLPLTPIQHWLLQTVQGPKHHFNHALLLRPLAPLDAAALEQALGLLMRHHDALRLTLRVGADGPIQEHHDTLDLTLERVSIGGADPAARLTAHAAGVQRGFDLAAGPLVRAVLYRLEDGSERLLLVIHHLVVDGVSWRILLADLAAAYASARRGEVARLPPKTHSFKAWAEFLADWAGSAALARELPYWRAAERQLAGQRLPYRGGGIPAARRPRTLSVVLEPAETAELLGSAHQAYRTRGNDLLLTALAIAGEQWHGSDRTVIALESHGRDHAGSLDLSRTIGWFTAIFPVVLDLGGAPTLGARIRLVKETLRAVPGNGVGYGLLRYLRPGTGLGTAEPALAFNYLGDFDQDLPTALFAAAPEAPGASVSPDVRLPEDLLLAGMVRERQLTLALTFDSGRLEEPCAAALLAAYVRALRELLAHCRAKSAGEITPADLTLTGLGLADFDRLLAQLGRAPTEIEDIYPLSPMQEGLLFHSLYDTGSTAFFQQMHYRIAGELDPAAFQAAWDLLAQRHAVLRTLFAHERLERPLQVVLKYRPMAFAYEDRRATGDAADYVDRLMTTERRQPFDLARDQLMRVALVRAGADRWHLLWTFHHILLDGWCLGILYRELLETYRALRAGQAPALAPAPSYATYLAWLGRQDAAAAARCWREDLAGFYTPTGVPPCPAASAGAAAGPVATDRFHLSADLTRALRATAAADNVTLSTVVQALWAVLLSRLTGRDDLVFGAAVAGRPESVAGVEGMVGLFMNTVPVRVRTPPRLRFRDLLRRIQARALALRPHEWYPLARIQAVSPLKQQLFDHLLVYENYPLETASAATADQAGLRLSPVEHYREINYALGLLIDPGERLGCHVLYAPARYGPGQIADLGRRLVHLAEAVTAGTDPLLGALAALSDEAPEAARTARLVPNALAQACEQLRRVVPGHRAGAAVPATIRDRRGHRVPDCARGIIHFAHDLPSGFSGRRIEDDLMEITEEPADLLVTDGTPLPLAGLSAALHRHPDLEDHALLKLQAKRGPRFVLVLAVGRRPLEAQQLAADLDNQVDAALRGRLAVMVVPALPLDAEGRLDRARVLAAIPVCEPGFATAALEAQILAELPQLADAAIMLETGIAPVPRLHIHDLLRSHRAYAAVSPPEADDPQTRDDQDEPTAGRAALPPAFADGGPVELDPDEPRTMVDALYRAARDYGHRGTLYVNARGEEHYQSYADLLYEARCLLGGLQAQGLQAGDTVILQQGSLHGHLTGFWACILGGIRPVTVATSPTYAQKTSVVNKLYNAWRLLEQPPIFASPDLVEPIEGLNALFGTTGIRAIAAVGYPPVDSDYRAAPDDIAFYQLTSGSTGIPKCIQERHRGIYYHVYGAAQCNAYTRDDVYLTWPPSDHVGALITLYIKAVYLGVKQLAVETDLILRDPLKWLDLLEAHQVTFTWSPNFGYKLLAEQLKTTERRWDLAHVRFFMNAAEQVTLPVVEEFLRLVRPFGVPERAMQPAYGMAETCTAMQYKNDFSVADGFHWIDKSSLKGQLRTSADRGRDAVSFVKLGPPMPGVQIRIVDARQRVLPEGRIGALHIRGEVITPGYLNNPQANAETRVGEGWLNTGDLGFILDGELSITGRQKEIIIVRAANFYCYEIEDIVNRVPGVEPTFAGATAIADPASGSEGLAIVFSPRPDADLIAVNRAIRAQIAMECGINPSFVVPLDRDSFPKTTSGKIQRLELREALEQGRFDATIREIDLALANERTLPSWFFTPHWRRRPVDGQRPGRPATPAPVCLLIADDSALQAALDPAVLVQSGTAFARAQPGRYTLDPECPEHYARLFEDLRESGSGVDTVVYALGYGGGAGAPAQCRGLDTKTWQRDTFGLLALIRAIPAAAPPLRQLLVLTRGAALVEPDDAPQRVNGSLRGIVRTLAQERPGLACRLLDLADGAAGEHAELIRAELDGAAPQVEVAYRYGERFVPCLRRVDFNALERRPIPFAADALYVLTGGLGGIGSEVARVLLVHYGCHLILTGRSALDAAPEKAAAFNRLRRLGCGTVEYHVVDAADRARLASLIGAAQTAGDRRLGGILHLAGESGATSGSAPEAGHLVNASLADAERVCHARVAGTTALLELIEDHPAAFFIGVSSVNGVFGGTGAGAYAAASGFLDAAIAAFNRRHPERPRAYGLCFSLWDGVGMSRDHDAHAAARAKGFEAITLARGIASFLVGIELGLPQLIVGLDPDNRLIQTWLEQAPLPEQELTAYYTLHEGVEADDAAVLARIDAIAQTWQAAALNDPT